MAISYSEPQRRLLGQALASRDVANKFLTTLAVNLNEAMAFRSDRRFLLTLPALDDPTAAGMANLPIYKVDTPQTLKAVGILAHEDYDTVSNGQPLVLTLKDGDGNTIVTKTFNDGTQPTDQGFDDLGALNGTHKVLPLGDTVTLTIAYAGTLQKCSLYLRLADTAPTSPATPATVGDHVRNQFATAFGDQDEADELIDWLNSLATLSDIVKPCIGTPIDDIAAGDSVTAYPVFVADAEVTLLATAIGGTWSGVDDDNTVVVTLKNHAGDTIAEATFDATTNPPIDGKNSLGDLDAVKKVVASGDVLTVDIVCGTTASVSDIVIHLLG